MGFLNAGFYFQDQHVCLLKIVARNPVDIGSYPATVVSSKGVAS